MAKKYSYDASLYLEVPHLHGVEVIEIDHAIGDAADQVGRDLQAIEIKQMRLDIAPSDRRHRAR